MGVPSDAIWQLFPPYGSSWLTLPLCWVLVHCISSHPIALAGCQEVCNTSNAFP